MIFRFRDGAWRYRYVDNRGRERWRRLSEREQVKLDAALAERGQS